MFEVVLIEPQIPPNTGNIGRLCVAVGARLHLVHPLGFFTDEKALRRAGMDYWEHLRVREWESIEAFWRVHPRSQRHFFLSTKGSRRYSEAAFLPGDVFYFGREDAGLPSAILNLEPQNVLRVPMREEARSLNLATSVGIVLYEALRQNYSAWEFLSS